MNRDAETQLTDAGVGRRGHDADPVPQRREAHIRPDSDVPPETEDGADTERGVVRNADGSQTDSAGEEEARRGLRIDANARIGDRAGASACRGDPRVEPESVWRLRTRRLCSGRFWLRNAGGLALRR